MREKDWQQTIMQAAGYLGYSCYHTFDSRRSAAGFPDLICVRGSRLVAIECKTERGRMRAGQALWLSLLGEVTEVVALVARPSDWDAVEAVLKEG